MRNGENIEKLFKESFEHFEADVNPKVWTNVQSGINSGIGSAAGTAAKFAIGKIIAAAAAVAVIAGSVWYFSQPESTKNSPVIVNNANNHPSKIITPPVEEQKIISNETSAAKKQSPTPAHSEKKSFEKKSNAQSQPLIASINKKEPAPANSNVENKTLPSQSANKHENAPKGDAGTIHNNPISKPTSTPEEGNQTASANNSLSNNTEQQETQNSINEEKPISEITLIPNTFTPNGDGENDFYFITSKNLASLNVEIDDLNGKKVAFWNTIDGKWDGTLPDGSLAPAGKYVYSILATGTDGVVYPPKQGFITLLR